jgi:hypothetical protein
MRFKKFMRTLNEAFGFDYTFPSDKNEAIYDFYALSMVDPETITLADYSGTKILSSDEDLRFSLLQAKKTNMNSMHDFMLEALRRAVIAELYHFRPFWGKSHDSEIRETFLKEYSGDRGIYDKLEKKINPSDYEYSDAYVPEYDERYSEISSLKISDSELFAFTSKAFGFEDGWNYQYGGKKWKAIADGGKLLLKTKTLPKDLSVWLGRFDVEAGNLLVAIDHAIDLAHNNGNVFTKWPAAAVEKQTLENKKYIRTLREYVKYVSYQLKAPLQHMTRQESKDDGFIKKHFNLRDKALTELPKDIPDLLEGNFNCSMNKLTSLKGAPSEIRGNFICSYNSLTSLEGAPKKVTGDFYCNGNKLATLEGAPTEVGKMFDCSANSLTSLKGAPKKCEDNFDCSANELTSLAGAPEKIGRNFKCNDNKLASLAGAPKEVAANFDCSDNAKEFTKEDVEKVCKVYGYIRVD